MLCPTCDFHSSLVLGLWLKSIIQECKKSERTSVLKSSPTQSNVWEKQPMSTTSGYTTFTVCNAELLTEQRSLIAARSSSDWTLCVTESRLIDSLAAVSSPVKDLDNICNQIKLWSNVHPSPTKRTMTANSSPNREVPSKMTERCFPVISWQIRPTSSLKTNKAYFLPTCWTKQFTNRNLQQFIRKFFNTCTQLNFLGIWTGTPSALALPNRRWITFCLSLSGVGTFSQSSRLTMQELKLSVSLGHAELSELLLPVTQSFRWLPLALPVSAMAHLPHDHVLLICILPIIPKLCSLRRARRKCNAEKHTRGILHRLWQITTMKCICMGRPFQSNNRSTELK